MTTPGKLAHIHTRASYVFRPGSTSPGLFGRKVTNIHGDATRKVRRYVTSCYATRKIIFLREKALRKNRLFVRSFVRSFIRLFIRYVPIPGCKEHQKSDEIPKGYNGSRANNVGGKLFAKYAREVVNSYPRTDPSQ